MILPSLILLTLAATSAWAAPSDLLGPREIFHGGKPDLLLKNIEAGNVPEEAWRKYIRGPGITTRSGLAPHRQGLYGYADVAPALRYGSWVMKVVLKDECRTEKHTLAHPERHSTWRLESNPEFARWIDRTTTPAVQENCIITNEHGSFWAEGEGYGKRDQKKEECQSVLETYLNENEYWVVQDNFADRAWYVRNRDCIEGLAGTPGDLLQWYSEPAFYLYQHKSDFPDRSKPQPAVPPGMRQDVQDIRFHWGMTRSWNESVCEAFDRLSNEERQVWNLERFEEINRLSKLATYLPFYKESGCLNWRVLPSLQN